mgnify:CR=1 FL=1
MWYIQDNQTFPVFTTYFHHSKEVFVCCLIVSLPCVFWVGLSIRGGGIDSPRPASQRAAAFILTAAMLTTLAAPAFAGTWYIENGDITVKASGTEGKNTVSQGNKKDVEDTNTIITNQNQDKASSHTVTIDANDKNDKVEVTLKDVNIDTSSRNKAAVSVTGSGNTTIKLDGDNALKSDTYRSGIYGSGSLTISGGENDSLTAQGGSGANGISSSGSLTISGGTVTANGGNGGYGIYSSGVTISGGTITANGGSGKDGSGDGIFSFDPVAISGGTVTAKGGSGEDGEDGGDGIRSFDPVAISGGTVTAKGGSGEDGSGGRGIISTKSVTISGGTVNANGGSGKNGNGGNGMQTAGICGFMAKDEGNLIQFCVNYGHISCPTGRTGGLVATLMNGNVKNSDNRGTVEDDIVGKFEGAAAQNSYNSKRMGGLIGGTDDLKKVLTATVESCTNYGNVFTHIGCRTGGFIGHSNIRIIGCANQGAILGDVYNSDHGPAWACGYSGQSSGEWVNVSSCTMGGYVGSYTTYKDNPTSAPAATVHNAFSYKNDEYYDPTINN